ncbi:hypothetical protein GCM10010177_69710 [Actinomadura citrea]|nr:hypothetical protein GCM10010177_69710 [Actinomadura citrea]
MTGRDDPRLGVINRLVAELSTLLQEPIEVVELLDDRFQDGEGLDFCVSIRSSPPQGNGFQLCWEGVMGSQLIQDGSRRASVTLFLYSRNRRLGMMEDREGSSLEIDYEGSLEHGGWWGTPRWLADEFGEFLGYESYGDAE